MSSPNHVDPVGSVGSVELAGLIGHGVWLRRYPFGLVAEEFYPALGEVLRATRVARGDTPAGVVERLRLPLTVNTLLECERGQRKTSMVRALDVCLALDASMPQVLDTALARTAERLAGAQTDDCATGGVGGRAGGRVDGGAGGRAVVDVVVVPSDRGEGEAVAAMDLAWSAQEAALELADGRRAMAATVGLREELVRVRQQLTQARARADRESQRAREAEVREADLAKALADTAAAHRKHIEIVRRAHESAMATLRDQHSTHSAEQSGAQAGGGTSVATGPGAAPPESAAGATEVTGARMLTQYAQTVSPIAPRLWKPLVEAVTVAEDADPRLAKVFATLTKNHQFVFKALAAGFIQTHIARALECSVAVVDRHTRYLCKKFGEPTRPGLAQLGRRMLTEGPDITQGTKKP